MHDRPQPIAIGRLNDSGDLKINHDIVGLSVKRLLKQLFSPCNREAPLEAGFKEIMLHAKAQEQLTQ